MLFRPVKPALLSLITWCHIMPQMELNTQQFPAQPVLPANDYYTFLTHSLPHSMFEKPRAKSKINPKTSECHKLNDSPHLLKSMEEYRQEYGKGMTVSHTLEDS